MLLNEELCGVLQALVRVCCLRAFGYFISQLHTVTFTFDDASATFCGPQPVTATTAPDQQVDQNMVRSSQHDRNRKVLPEPEGP